jgi:hypothetical protein
MKEDAESLLIMCVARHRSGEVQVPCARLGTSRPQIPRVELAP